MTARRLDPLPSAERSRLFLIASVAEATLGKPGNVSPGRDFDDLTFDDLVQAAVAAAPAIGQDGIGLGRVINSAMNRVMRSTRTNANLGIVLLAAVQSYAAGLGVSYEEVIAATNNDDARGAYCGIRRANPGGLGTVAEGDIRQPPPGTLTEMMHLAAGRDAVARQFDPDDAMPDVRRIARELRRGCYDGGELGSVGPRVFAVELATHPDTLIARKNGPEEADRVRQAAAGIVGTDAATISDDQLAELDARLRTDDHRMNPGTTADLFAAALYHILLADGERSPIGQQIVRVARSVADVVDSVSDAAGG